MDLLDDLDARGLIHDVTDRAALAARLAAGPLGIYIGFDPTADSLHVGHLVGQLFLRRFQLAGHRPFALAGGATGMIGDPSGRSEERNLLDRDTLRHNVVRIEAQLARLLDFEPGRAAATLVDNADWTEPMSMLEFLRDVGKYAPVSQMLARDSVRARLDGDGGLSFTEFSYALLQANDFRYLYEHHGVELQSGASDQWGNVVAGVDLVRRRLGAVVHGLTHPLITKSDGAKFGKSVGGAVWLDPARTSPYAFHQFWLNVDDAMVATYLRMLSLRPLAALEADLAAHRAVPQRRIAQRALADELTTMVHGDAATKVVTSAAAVLFGGDALDASADVLTAVAAEVGATTVTREALGDPVALLVATGLAASRSEARRLLQQGSVRANDQLVVPDASLLGLAPLHERYVLLRKGKRSFHVVEISPGPG